MNTKEIQIIPFQAQYATDFYQLNIEWLEKYFYVEEYDEKVLRNPQSYILDTNGFIFFAIMDNKVIGTYALINQKECYELSKMAISPKYQGLKIGQQLLEHCIQFSREQGWFKIMLYTSSVLKPAMHLYQKFDFIEVKLEKEVIYDRADIKMELKL